MRNLNERILQYSQGGFFDGQWQLDGTTPEEALLGVGTYGHVYGLVSDERDMSTGERQTAAIKIIPIDEECLHLSKDKPQEERQLALNKMLREVEDEIAIMQRVKGAANIAYFRDYEKIERTDTDLRSWDVLILMDRLITLDEFLKQSPTKPGTHEHLVQTLHLWRDISSALHVCENIQVIHADVKPANILYHPMHEEFKLGDFGVSIPSGSFKRGISYGTLEYMSPEMYNKEGGDSRSDMYSLAVMIYEMLNGDNLPLQKGSDRKEASLQRLIGKKTIPAIKGIPQEVNAVLLKCLERDPNKRYSSCKELEEVVLDLYVTERKRKGDLKGNKLLKQAIIAVAAIALVSVGIFVVSKVMSDKKTIETPTESPTEAIETLSTDASSNEALEETATTDEEASIENLAIDEKSSKIEGSKITINGNLSTYGEVSSDVLIVSINNNVVDATWNETENGYAFTATQEMDLDGVDELAVRVSLRGDRNVEPVQAMLPVSQIAQASAPTEVPTSEPTEEPTPEPTEEPTPEPTEEPTPEPTEEPTPEPTEEPTPEPTQIPTPEPKPVMGRFAAYSTPEESVFNGPYERKQIATITFTNTLADAPADAWDISENGDGSVMAWATPNNVPYVYEKGEEWGVPTDGLYDLVIAGRGGIQAPESCRELFSNFVSLRSIKFNGCFDTSNVSDMGYMFEKCYSLIEVDLSTLDTGKVKDMVNMFGWCGSLFTLDVSGFKTTYVRNMALMFANCSKLTKLDLSNFDTRNVGEMSSMFSGCSSLQELDLSSFETKLVTNMSNMFRYCANLKRIVFPESLDTSDVENMSGMFIGCAGLTDLDLARFNTENVVDMNYMFSGCTGLARLDLSSFRTGSVTNMDRMFYGASGLQELLLTNFDTTSVTDMDYMFADCSSLLRLDLSMFTTPSLETMQSIFSGCSALNELTIPNFDLSGVDSLENVFYGCESLPRLDLSELDTMNVSNMRQMFARCSSLTELILSDRFDTSNVSNFRQMFYMCESLKSLTDATKFIISDGADTTDMYWHCPMQDQNMFTNAFNGDFETLKRGDKGEAVENLQQGLVQCNYLFDIVDGSYGAKTEQAVMLAQADAGMEQNGIADPLLQSLLDQRSIMHEFIPRDTGHAWIYAGDYMPDYEGGALAFFVKNDGNKTMVGGRIEIRQCNANKESLGSFSKKKQSNGDDPADVLTFSLNTPLAPGDTTPLIMTGFYDGAPGSDSAEMEFFPDGKYACVSLTMIVTNDGTVYNVDDVPSVYIEIR